MTLLMDNLADGALDSILTIAGESIVYRPNGGTARTITALVRRGLPEPNAPGVGPGALTATVVTITVKNHATEGILNESINAGADKVDVAVREGDTAATLRIMQIVKQTPAWQTFEVRGGKAAS